MTNLLGKKTNKKIVMIFLYLYINMNNNPKTYLFEIIDYLKTNPIKLVHLIDFLNKDNERKTVITDTNDYEYLTQLLKNHRVKPLTSPQDLWYIKSG
jgi:hypothetical protein